MIVDAAFLRRSERDDFRRLAQEMRRARSRCCTARRRAAVLRERVRARGERGDDASEADLAVLDKQLAGGRAAGGRGREDTAITVDTRAPVEIEALAARWLARAECGGCWLKRGPARARGWPLAAA